MKFSFREPAVDPILNAKYITNHFEFYVRPQVDSTTESVRIFFQLQVGSGGGSGGEVLSMYHLKRFEVSLVSYPSTIAVQEVVTKVRGRQQLFITTPSFDRSSEVARYLEKGLKVKIELSYIFHDLTFCAFQQVNGLTNSSLIHMSKMGVTSPQDHLDRLHSVLSEMRLKVGEASFGELVEESYRALGMAYDPLEEEYINASKELEASENKECMHDDGPLENENEVGRRVSREKRER